MSDDLSDPGHVGYVRLQFERNRQRIAAAVEAPAGSTGDDVVRWMEALLAEHHAVCKAHHDRTVHSYSRFTGD